MTVTMTLIPAPAHPHAGALLTHKAGGQEGREENTIFNQRACTETRGTLPALPGPSENLVPLRKLSYKKQKASKHQWLNPLSRKGVGGVEVR